MPALRPGGALQRLQAMHPDLSGGRDRLGHRGPSGLHGATLLHRLYGSLPGPALLGSDARASRKTVMDDRGAADKTAGIVGSGGGAGRSGEAGTSGIEGDSE